MNILIVDDEISAIRNLVRVLGKVVTDAKIETADNGGTALSLCRDKDFDVAFLDIEMPGKDGITLAKEIKEIKPLVNIVMVTAYPQYALDALRIYVSGYILKPVSRDDVRNALLNLRTPLHERTEGLFIRCFGSFEVFFSGKPVRFARSKSKELLAYLIDRRGSAATNAECCAVLWVDYADGSERKRYYFHQIWADLKNTLSELGCADILVQERNAYSIDTDAVACDYYLALKQNVLFLSRFSGEYMSQYDWAEGQVGALINLKNQMEEKV